jgi:hypothetical protein
VPENFKGKFRVRVQADLGPFEVKSERTWHEVK